MKKLRKVHCPYCRKVLNKTKHDYYYVKDHPDPDFEVKCRGCHKTYNFNIA